MSITVSNPTYTISYVGNPRWGILEPYIEEEYTLIMNNKLFMEANAAGGKFCISEGVLKNEKNLFVFIMSCFGSVPGTGRGGR